MTTFTVDGKNKSFELDLVSCEKNALASIA